VTARFSALAASLVVLGLVGAGCSGDPAKPKPLKSSTAAAPSSSGGTASASPSASATASSSAAAPSMPDAAKGSSAAAAKTFVRYWVAVLDYSGPRGESALLRRLSSARCLDCEGIADFIDSVSRHGGRIAGAGWTVKNANVTSRSRDGSVTIKAAVRVHPQTVVLKEGARPRKFYGADRVKTFKLTRGGAHWVVVRLDQGV